MAVATRNVSTKEEVGPQTVHANNRLTIASALKNIPKDCFKRVMWKSYAYLAFDISQVVFMSYFMQWFWTWSACMPFVARQFSYLMCAVWQGTNLASVWVVGHECGHGSFSNSEFVNDLTGFLVHTPLMVPYFSWQQSHAKHHAFCNHMTKDAIFVPRIADKKVPTPRSGPKAVMYTLLMGTLGWYIYLATNMGGPEHYETGAKFVSHYDPWCPMFSRIGKWKVVVNDLALVGILYAVYQAIGMFGWGLVWYHYLAPITIVTCWLSFVTFLHHTDEDILHYDESVWTVDKGATSTVDRSMGWFMDWKTHHICDTHVCHHLFSKIPHYNALKATVTIKELMGDAYEFRVHTFPFGLMHQLYHNMCTCRRVIEKTPGSGIYIYPSQEEAARLNAEFKAKAN